MSVSNIVTRRRCWAAVLCAVFVCTGQAGFAQVLPERFHGVWKLIEGETGACKQSDWSGNARTDAHIRVAPRQVEHHEAMCRFVSVQTRQPDHETYPVRLSLSCSGEGEKWQSSRIWQIRKVDGASMLLAAVTDRGREAVFIYRQCDGAVEAATPARAATAASLPLKRGFYVAADTPCGSASNATLQLVRRDGINVSRMACDFKRIEQTGATTYRVTEECRELTRDDPGETLVRTYDVANDSRFKVTGSDGQAYSARYCAQSSLPAPWRNNDIRDLIR
jgi:hypothetical protein